MRVPTAWAWTPALLLVAVQGPAFAAGEPAPSSPPKKANITISRKTTYLTGPLNEDGTVNYVAALNARHLRGLTTQNNAAVELLRAFGLQALPEPKRKPMLKKLGLAEANLKGPYFERFVPWLKRTLPKEKLKEEPQEMPAKLPEDILKDDPEARRFLEVLRKQRGGKLPGRIPAVEQAHRRYEQTWSGPWKAQDYPLAAAWLKHNRIPLDRLVEASRQRRLFFPLIPSVSPPTLREAAVLPLLELRYAAGALGSRALLRYAAGRFPAAKSDIRAIARLGTLLRQQPSAVAALMSLPPHGMAFGCCRASATSEELSAEEARALMQVISGVPDTNYIHWLNGFWRLATLDEELAARRKAGWPDREGLDEALRGINAMFDMMVAAEGKEPWQARQKAWDGVEKAVLGERIDEGHLRREFLGLLEEVHAADGPPTDASGEPASRKQRLASLAMNLLALRRTSVYFTASDTDAALTRIALALAGFHAETARYPDRLSELDPKWLREIPKDPFSGEPFGYRKTGDGVILYSVGEDMTDDGGDRDEDVVYRAPRRPERGQ